MAQAHCPFSPPNGIEESPEKGEFGFRLPSKIGSFQLEATAQPVGNRPAGRARLGLCVPSPPAAPRGPWPPDTHVCPPDTHTGRAGEEISARGGGPALPVSPAWWPCCAAAPGRCRGRAGGRPYAFLGGSSCLDPRVSVCLQGHGGWSCYHPDAQDPPRARLPSSGLASAQAPSPPPERVQNPARLPTFLG